MTEVKTPTNARETQKHRSRPAPNAATSAPDVEGSTTTWGCEQPDSSIITISDDSDTNFDSLNDSSTASPEDSYASVSYVATDTDGYEYSYSEQYRASISSTESSDLYPSNSSRSIIDVSDSNDNSTSSYSFESTSSSRKSEGSAEELLRPQTFHQRSWCLEECSICLEIMLIDEELMNLPCAHNFHTACIAPWLAKRRRCPNCRTVAQ